MSRLAKEVMAALTSSVDHAALDRALQGIVARGSSGTASSGKASSGKTSSPPPSGAAAEILSKILLTDLLDDSILSARPSDASFPLRMLLGELGDALDGEHAFALACGLNLYFRASLDEESRLRVGLEISRLYYHFAEARPLADDLRRAASPLLARLLSTELDKLRFESVDGATTFDSSLHERAPGADGSRSALRTPKSFLCRVVSSSMVRAKAQVMT